MPMIDIYATRGTFQDVHQLAQGRESQQLVRT